jgi:diguanylate cyclase (GGDEF)-like protein
MTRVVDRLAELTGYKDRDVMDVSLAQALRDMILPLSIGIHRVVGQQVDRRWLCRARLTGTENVPQADSLTSKLEDLPPLTDFPQRLDCLLQRELRESAVEGGFLTHFPLVGDFEREAVLEIHTAKRLGAADRRTVSGMLRVFHNFQSLLDDAERDPLTGLLNRKTFDANFLKLMGSLGHPAPMAPHEHENGDAAERRHEAAGCWLGVVDIDHFKRVNDGFGHLIGDEVLLLLARLMRGSFRFHDQLYRFGGEEFVALIRCDSADDALQAFERLRQACASFPFPQVGRVTLSIGFTQLRPGDSPTAAFDRADKAVYHAKQHGRDQVQGHETLVAQGHLTEPGRSADDVELF